MCVCVCVCVCFRSVALNWWFAKTENGLQFSSGRFTGMINIVVNNNNNNNSFISLNAF